jgi:hypothetical protein
MVCVPDFCSKIGELLFFSVEGLSTLQDHWVLSVEHIVPENVNKCMLPRRPLKFLGGPSVAKIRKTTNVYTKKMVRSKC